MPRCTYGPATLADPLGPTVPTAAPSATDAPFATATEPRWVRVTERASAVRIETVRPLEGTLPANVTTPAAGAPTGAPREPAPMSMPRCWPAAYGWAGSNEYGATTGPVTGHV